MKKHLLASMLLLNCLFAFSQLITPPPGGNKKAMVGERIGITDVTIKYDRPGVKGREGKIYGTPVVHEGFIDLSQDFGTATMAPWRAGANENTTIEFTTDVKVEGKEIPAGKYGFFVAFGQDKCELIFSKDNASWGSYFYDEKKDALRVTVKPVKLDKSVEWLKYEFIDETDNSAVVALEWEKIRIPFKVEVDLVQTQLASFRKSLMSEKGFDPEAYAQAANFCLRNNTDLEEGLKWADRALLFDKSFKTMSTKALFLEKTGKTSEADALMKDAIPLATMMELHQYGKNLLSMRKNKEALEVFQQNFKKNPKQFTTYVGLARGYSASGDYKNALVNAKAALPLAPDDGNKRSVESMIKKLDEKKDIN